MLTGAELTSFTNNERQITGKDMKKELTLTQEWDKTFPLSEKVNHRKVTFPTQFGLTLAADLYTPKDAASSSFFSERSMMMGIAW